MTSSSHLNTYVQAWMDAFVQAHQNIRPFIAFRQAPWVLESTLRDPVARYLSQSNLVNTITIDQWKEHLSAHPPQVKKWVETCVFIHPNWAKPMDGKTLLDQPLYQKQILGHTTLGQADQVYDRQQQFKKDVRDLTLDVDTYVALHLRQDLEQTLSQLAIAPPKVAYSASTLASSLKAQRDQHSSSFPSSSTSPRPSNGVSEFLRKKP